MGNTNSNTVPENLKKLEALYEKLERDPNLEKAFLTDKKKFLEDHGFNEEEVNNLINKQKEIAEKNANIYADKISDELKRKNIAADREIQYLHTEAATLIRNKIATITLSTVEEIANNEFKDTKSDTIYENFISNIPKALKS